MLAPIIKGLLLGLILSISLGPVIFAILKQSITNGRKAGYLFVAGVSTSDIGQLLIANIFTNIFLLVLDHKAFIAMAGAGFLLLLGLYTLFFKKIKIESDENGEEKVFRKRDYLGIYISGFLMNTLNPSVFIFWFAWTAAIGASAAETNNPVQYKFIVFATCLVFLLLSDLIKVTLASRLRPSLMGKNLIWINRLSAIIILVFSAALFIGALKY
ncbi:MAG: LysE family translocator [Sediminibacterium sp.]|jgi:threonine/homoserine/homoserine lactone efflux protein|nr:LysE family translocator [Sediminibacterium sp.]